MKFLGIQQTKSSINLSGYSDEIWDRTTLVKWEVPYWNVRFYLQTETSYSDWLLLFLVDIESKKNENWEYRRHKMTTSWAHLIFENIKCKKIELVRVDNEFWLIFEWYFKLVKKSHPQAFLESIWESDYLEVINEIHN